MPTWKGDLISRELHSDIVEPVSKAVSITRMGAGKNYSAYSIIFNSLSGLANFSIL